MKLQTITISATFALLATTALSQTTRDDVIQMLSKEGYSRIEISRTLFGNTKFEASGPLGEREVVLGKDGATLRDHSDENDDESKDTSYSVSASDEYDDDDDENDDDSSSYGSSNDESDSSSSSSGSDNDESDDDSDDDENDSDSDDDENDSNDDED